MYNLSDFIIDGDILVKCETKEKIINIPYGIKIIGENCFKGCISIEEIYMPDTVEEIKAHGFKGCKNIKKINISKNLNKIGDYAFHRCHNLENIELPLSVEELGNCVFLYCDNMKEINISGVKKFGKQVFLNNVNLEKIHISKNIDVNCIIDVFTGCSKLNEIYFSDNTYYKMKNSIDVLYSESDAPQIVKIIVKDIYRMMDFENGIITKFLTNLRDVELCEGIKEIGKSCFFDKKGIINVKFPKSLKKINNKAFRNCLSLEKIEFKNDNVEICNDAFKNCTSLKYIKLANGDEYELLGIGENYNNLPSLVKKIYNQVLSNFIISGNVLIKYVGIEEKVTIPEGIEIIGEKAFANNETIVTMVLPNSIKIIEDEAFSDCIMMQKINLPQNINYIGKSAFENCVKLIKVELPQNIDTINKSTFSRCQSLSDVILNDNIKIIDDLAFYKCKKLKNINIKYGIEYIGELAFYMCNSLYSVNIPQTVRFLGNSSFSASGVRFAEINCKSTERDVFSYCKKLKEIVFCEGAEKIGANFAYGCSNLINVSFPSTIKYIERNAFFKTPFLDNIEENENGIKIKYNIIFEVKNCNENITINDDIKVIAGGAFYNNNNIVKVDFNKSFKYINEYTFCECKNLKEVILPENIKEIPKGFFEGCNNLEKVLINNDNNTVEIINEKAFLYCENIKTMFSLNNIKGICYSSFYYLYNIFKNNNNKHSIHMIDESYYNTKLFNNVAESFDNMFIFLNCVINGINYKQEVLYIPEGIESISGYAFYQNKYIKKVVLPKSLKYIGQGCFFNCENLEKIEFNSKLDFIGKEAFSRCISLKQIDLEIDCIEENTFSWCTSLKTINLKNTYKIKKYAFMGCNNVDILNLLNINFIGQEAFSYCDNINEVNLSSVNIIGEKAFFQCKNLESLILSENNLIYSRAFENCSSLKFIKICGYAKNLIFRSYAFIGCTDLYKIADNENIYIIDGIDFLKNENYHCYIKRIYASALSCFYINENNVLEKYYNYSNKVAIPNGVVSIGDEVFKNHTNLEYITIPKSVNYIGYRAFHNTLWLEQKSKDDIVVVNDMIIYGSMCKGVVTIPENIKLICGWAFAAGYGIEKIVFNVDENYLKIDDYTFRNCINLKSVVLKNGSEYTLSSVEDKKRTGIPNIVKKIFNESYNCFKVDEYNILYECTKSIKNMNFPKDIMGVGEEVLKQCYTLENVNFNNELKILKKECFMDCYYINTIKNNNNVEIIEEKAFANCINLKYIDSFEKLKKLGKKSFENCENLKEIILSEELEEIPEKTFFRCKNLEKIIIPSSVKAIGKEAFAFCSNLKYVIYNGDKNLINISEDAFNGCNNLMV